MLREGDWRAIFAAYNEWLKTWFQPVAPRKPWFERIFALSSGNAHYDASPDPQTRGNVQRLVDTMHKYIGPCDYVHLFGWGASKQYGDWGDYDHYEEVGGLDYFRGNIQRVQQQGQAVSVYLDGYLSSEKGQHAGAHAKAWAMQRRDGSPQFVEEYQSYNECPYQEGWRKYLSETYARVQREIGPQIMYIDEIGATDGRWTCWATGPRAQRARDPLSRAKSRCCATSARPWGPRSCSTPNIRRRKSAASTSTAASPTRPCGAPTRSRWPRTSSTCRASPSRTSSSCTSSTTWQTRAGNWWLLKFPFFNGEVYRNGEPNLPGMDAPSLAFLKRAIEVQCAHREAFASHDVQPLVPTEVAGVFANRFSAQRRKCVDSLQRQRALACARRCCGSSTWRGRSTRTPGTATR